MAPERFSNRNGRAAQNPSHTESQTHSSLRRAVAHMIRINPTNDVATVMNFVRSRFATPSTIVGWRSASVGRSREAAIGTVIRVAVNHQCGNVIARSSPFVNGIAACLRASTVWIVLSRRWLVSGRFLCLRNAQLQAGEGECQGEDYSYMNRGQ